MQRNACETTNLFGMSSKKCYSHDSPYSHRAECARVRIELFDGAATWRLVAKLSQNDSWLRICESDIDAAKGKSKVKAISALKRLESNDRKLSDDTLGKLFADGLLYCHEWDEGEWHSCPTVIDIIRWYGLHTFTEVNQFGFDIAEQNMAYSVDNHLSMVHDRTRVDAYFLAIHRAAKDRIVLDVGTGPFCLLGRMAIGAGAQSVTAVEHSEMAIQKAVHYLKQDFRDQTNKRRRELLVDYDALRHTAAAEWGTRYSVTKGHHITETKRPETLEMR